MGAALLGGRAVKATVGPGLAPAFSRGRADACVGLRAIAPNAFVGQRGRRADACVGLPSTWAGPIVGRRGRGKPRPYTFQGTGAPGSPSGFSGSSCQCMGL